MTAKIFKNTFLVGLFVLLLCAAVFFGLQYTQTKEETYDALKQEAVYAAHGLSMSGAEYLKTLDTEHRITWIAADGSVLYDNQYRNEDKVAAKFVPDGYVALIPSGTLGETCYGTTPEEADLMGKNIAQVQIVETGIAVTQIVDPHPVNVNTFASEIVLPSFERMDEVGLLKVIA